MVEVDLERRMVKIVLAVPVVEEIMTTDSSLFISAATKNSVTTQDQAIHQ